MAKGQDGGEPTTWVPAGLKVRGTASDPHSGPLADATEIEEATASAWTESSEAMSARVPTMNAQSNTAEASKANDAPMTSRITFKPMPVLTILSLICLGLLIWLGNWQWEKFVLKSRLPAVSAVNAPSSVSAALEAAKPEYRPVVVEGISDPRTVKISVVQEGVRGYRLFSPVVLEAGGIFVDRGFVGEDDISRALAPTGQVRLLGVLRKGAKPNRYTPDNDPAADVWYWPDLTAMSDMLVIQTTSAQYYVALTHVDPLGTGKPIVNPYADSKGANQVPPERHLGYALTWWGFGLALLGVYIGLHVRTGRLQFHRTIASSSL